MEEYDDVNERRRRLRRRRTASTTSASNNHTWHATPLPSFTLALFNATLSHIAHCVPLVLELPESFTAASLTIPVLGQNGAFQAEKRDNVNLKRTVCAPLTGSTREVLRRAAALELVLYEAVFNATQNHLLKKMRSYPLLHECIYAANSVGTKLHSDAIPVVLVVNAAQRQTLEKAFESLLGRSVGMRQWLLLLMFYLCAFSIY